jgi:hypothetical protein
VGDAARSAGAIRAFAAKNDWWELLALAAALVAGPFAAGFAVALLVAAVAAVDGLGFGGPWLAKGGGGEDEGERKSCDGAFHGILLIVGNPVYKSSRKAGIARCDCFICKGRKKRD